MKVLSSNHISITNCHNHKGMQDCTKNTHIFKTSFSILIYSFFLIAKYVHYNNDSPHLQFLKILRNLLKVRNSLKLENFLKSKEFLKNFKEFFSISRNSFNFKEFSNFKEFLTFKRFLKILRNCRWGESLLHTVT